MKTPLPLLLLSVIAAGASAAEPTKAPASTTPAATAPAVAPATPPAAAPASGKSAAPANTRTNTRGASPSAASADALANFQIITDRNIFNANRRPGVTVGREGPPPVKTDEIRLYGVTEDDKGPRAFFDGSDSSYRKSLHVGESVDKFKVTKIEPKVVELERDGKTIAVNVGQALKRPEGADWTLSATDLSVQPRAGMMGSPSRPDPNAPVEIPANADEVTRRLMERRAKTLKN
jgi:hypothetical protein